MDGRTEGGDRIIWESVWKTVRRTLLKSILYFIILGLISLVLCIGINLLVITNSNTGRTKQAFHIISVLKSKMLDSQELTREYDAIFGLSYVSAYQPMQIAASGDQLKAFERDQDTKLVIGRNPETGDDFADYEQMLMVVTYLGDELVRVDKKLFGMHHCEGSVLPLSNYSQSSWELLPATSYIVYGKLKVDPSVQADTGPSYIGLEIYDYEPNYYISNGTNFLENAFHKEEDSQVPDFMPGIEPYDKRSGYWEDIQRALELSEHPIKVMSVRDAENLYDFHEGVAWLSEGSYFTGTDYESGSMKCILDRKTAQENGLKTGDRLKLHFYISLYLDFDLGMLPSNYSPSFPDFWGNDKGEAEFEIIGIFDMASSSRNDNDSILKGRLILIPEQTMGEVLGQRTMEEFRIGSYARQLKYVSVQVETERVEDYIKEISGLAGIEARVYDQGYSKVKASIERFNAIAKLTLLAASLCAVMITGLFAFLEFGRRKQEAYIMTTLGCEKKQIRYYLLLTLLVISIPASFLGGAAGFALSDTLVQKLQGGEARDQAIAYEEYYGTKETVDLTLSYDTVWYSIAITFLGLNAVVLVFGVMGSGIIAANPVSRKQKKRE